MHPPYHDLDSFRSRADVADAPSGDRPAAAVNAFPVAGRRGSPAFTLVEMLVVMGVIVTLLVTTIPVVKNLIGGRPVEQSINSVSGVLELGRATAMSQRTYVYVLFLNSTNSDNNAELNCAVVQSMNGTFGIDASDIPNLRPVTKLIKIPNVKNVQYSQMPTAVQNVTPTDLQNDSVYIAGWYPSGQGSHFPDVVIDGFHFQGATYIRFDDDAEIGTSDDNYSLLVQPVICLGLAKTIGTVVQTAATDGAIVACYGNTAKLRVFRP